MQKFLSIFISVIFHPLIMPAAGVFLLFNSGIYISLIPDSEKAFIYYVIIGCTIVLPLLLIPFFIYNYFSSNNNEERNIHYFINLCFNYFAYYILKKNLAPDIVTTFILACFIAISIALLLSIKYKISLHMVGIGGITALTVILSLFQVIDAPYFLIASLFLSGLIGYARLYLNAHNSFQIYSGFFLGMISILTTFYFVISRG